MKLISIVLIFVSLLRVDFVYSGLPEWALWGKPELVTYDNERHLFINRNIQLQSFYLNSDLKWRLENSQEEIPEKKIPVIRLEWIKDTHYELLILMVVQRQRKIKTFFVHCSQDTDWSERFDTIMMPNGTIASLTATLDGVRKKFPFLEAGTAIDESFIGSEARRWEQDHLANYLAQEIELNLSKGIESVVFCTVLTYNAERSLLLLRELKKRFGSGIRTGVGGQLIRISPTTYRKPFIDHIGVGDAEVVLEQLLIDRQPFAEGYLMPTRKIHYSGFSYENYLGIRERLGEMARYRLGPFSNIRNLVVESVRGCSWAYSTGRPCEMCALESITSRPVFRPLREHFELENQLFRDFGINWIFDVSNQFLPVMGEKNQQKWLIEYLKARERYSQYDLNRYVYLTANSISETTLPLIREAGIGVAYLGIDGWDIRTRHNLHKAQIEPQETLRLCRKYGLYVRTSMVIGAGLNEANLNELPLFVDTTMEEFGDIIISWGNFIQAIIPGSPTWEKLRVEANQNSWNEVKELFDFFFTNGYLSLDQQDLMSRFYVEYLLGIDYNSVVEARDKAVESVEKYKVTGTTFRDGGHLKKT